MQLEIFSSRQFPDWLAQQNISLALTTYQTGQLIFLGVNSAGQLSGFQRLYDRAMGLYATPERLYLSCKSQLWQLDNALSPGELHQGYDKLYVPRIGYTTGDLDIHDLALDRQNRIIFVSSLLNCLATVSDRRSCKPLWKPAFISRIINEDRCHLNGMAMVDGQPGYVTACSRSDLIDGWRDRRIGGGIVIDVATNEIVCTDLTMPHSPRWYRDKLWLHNSGKGELGYVDLQTGKFEAVAFCPGYLRGLAFWENYAIVGLSKPRAGDRTFSGLPLDELLEAKDGDARCGLMVVDLNTGAIANWVRFEGQITELYDVQILPNVKRPMALGFQTEEIAQLISLEPLSSLNDSSVPASNSKLELPAKVFASEVETNHNSSQLKFLVEKSPTPIYQRIIDAFSRALTKLGYIVIQADPNTYNSIKDYMRFIDDEQPDFCLLTNPECYLARYSEETDCFPFEKLDTKLIFVHHDNIFSNLHNAKDIQSKLKAFFKTRTDSYHFCIEYCNVRDLQSIGISQAYPIQHASEFKYVSVPESYTHELSFLGHILPGLADTLDKNTQSRSLKENIWNRVNNLAISLEDNANDFAIAKLGDKPPSIEFLSLKYAYISMLHNFSQSFRGEIVEKIERGKVDIIGGDPAYIHGLNMNRKIVKQNINYYPPLTDYQKAHDLYAKTKINLNISSLQFDYAVINRVIDVGMAGGFILTDWRPGLEKITRVYNEISYKTVAELNEKINYYLHPQHERERLKIAKVLHQDVSDKCSYQKVVEFMLSKINPQSTAPTEALRLDLGCGDWKPEGFIGVDLVSGSQVDIVTDLNRRFPFADCSATVIRAHDIVEHLTDRIHTMNQIWRIAKPDAEIDIRVPSTDGRGAFQDPTHVSFWNRNSFKYYCIEFPAYLKLCRSYGFQGAFSINSLTEETSEDDVVHVRANLKVVKDLTCPPKQLKTQPARASFQPEQIERPIKDLPNSVVALLERSSVLKKQKDLAQAEVCLRQAISLQPDCWRAFNNLGTLLQNQGNITEAKCCYQKAIEFNADFAHAISNLASISQLEEDWERATNGFNRALQLKPDYVPAHLNLANLYKQQQRLGAAIEHFEQVIALQPDCTEAYFNLGQIFEYQGKIVEALRYYQQAQLTEPNANHFACYITMAQLRLCDWENYETKLAQLTEIVKSDCFQTSTYGFNSYVLNAFSADLDLHQIAAQNQARIIAQNVASLKAKVQFKHEYTKPQKLRIGFISPDFREHAVGRLIYQIFPYFDRDRFEIYAYSTVDVDDWLTKEVRSGCDAFIDLSSLSTEAAAKRIYDDGIHVMVDLAGYTIGNAASVLALQPAAIQAQWLGYPDTIGADFIQYYLGDRTLITDEIAQHYTEEIIYLPHTFVASPLKISKKPMTRTEFGLPDDAFVFCCFNSHYKITPELFDLWLRILERVPQAILWLGSGAGTDNLRLEAKKRGLADNRLVFADKIPHEEYLARYALADLYLDTFIYNAGSTATAVLWSGLPMLTCPGKINASRMGASICKAAGLDTICDSPEEYEARAVYLATHPQELAQLRQQLNKSNTPANYPPLFQLEGFVRSLETAIEKMWAKFGSKSVSKLTN